MRINTALISCLAIIVLNIFDSLSTALLVINMGAIEINPIMNLIISYIGWWFILPKIIIVTTMAVFLYHTRNSKLSRIGLFVCACFYFFTIGTHLLALNHVGLL